jgi:hypothetical protein
MTDDELLDLLRSRDPAASLSPAGTTQVDRLLEDAMSHDLDTRGTDGTFDRAGTDPRRRTPLTWLVAAAAVLVIAGVGVFAVFGGDGEPTPTAKDPAPSVLELSAPPPTAAKCAVVSAELLGLQETAFDGTVTAVTEGLVTIEVAHWYRGGGADQVTVEAPPTDLQALIQAADFRTGQRYLVAANDGFVTACGMTAPYSEELAALYTQAFGA